MPPKPSSGRCVFCNHKLGMHKDQNEHLKRCKKYLVHHIVKALAQMPVPNVGASSASKPTKYGSKKKTKFFCSTCLATADTEKENKLHVASCKGSKLEVESLEDEQEADAAVSKPTDDNEDEKPSNDKNNKGKGKMIE